MNYKVENLLIPESYVRISMKTEEFDKLIANEIEDIGIVYIYMGARYFFMDEEFVIEELVERKRKWFSEIEI